MFSAYLKLGMDHILDPNGYDHILFVTVLCAIYDIKSWKSILILVTAFTIGHSLTLALSAMDYIYFDPTLIERLIPITIILTSIYNIFASFKPAVEYKAFSYNYYLALGFGLIHGLGFSNYFKAILGSEESILLPLFAFNVGVEFGQILIVIVVIFLGFLWINIAKLPQRIWIQSISIAAIIVAGYLLSQR